MTANIEKAIAFYVDGLGFTIKLDWRPNGAIQWCWLERDGVAFMLQEYRAGDRRVEALGQGVSICIMCNDALALYQEFRNKGLSPDEPSVGNMLWVVSITDPDGYRLQFESKTDVPEDTRYSDYVKPGNQGR